MRLNRTIEKCPFCGSTASVGVDADCDGYQGTIGVFCDNPGCGGAYLWETRTISGDYARWIESFLPSEISDVIDGWNSRGSAVVRGLIANQKHEP